MSGAIVDGSMGEKRVIRVGERNVTDFMFYGIPNLQILYFRLPGGTNSGQGYNAHNKESLRKLYTGEIKSMTAIDGSATYTLDQIKETIASILRGRRMNNIQVLNHKADLPVNKNYASFDHADHIITAKIVLDVVRSENITSNVTV